MNQKIFWNLIRISESNMELGITIGWFVLS